MGDMWVVQVIQTGSGDQLSYSGRHARPQLDDDRDTVGCGQDRIDMRCDEDDLPLNETSEAEGAVLNRDDQDYCPGCIPQATG